MHKKIDTTISFYKFIKIDDLENLKLKIHSYLKELNIYSYSDNTNWFSNQSINYWKKRYSDDLGLWNMKIPKIIPDSSEGHHIKIFLFEWSQVLLERLFSQFYWIYTFTVHQSFLVEQFKVATRDVHFAVRIMMFLFVIHRFNLTDWFLSIVIFWGTWLFERIQM